MRWKFGLLAVWLACASAGPVAVRAQINVPAPAQDSWHQVVPGSPFFTADTADLRMAAVMQSDGRFARIILGDGPLGAYVTVNLPGAAPAAALRSDLVYSNGGILTRTVQGDALDVQPMTTTDSVTYSFSIAREDLRAFRGATTWTLTPEGGAPVKITLSGSARAIRAALSDPRPIVIPGTETEPEPEQAALTEDSAAPLPETGAEPQQREP